MSGRKLLGLAWLGAEPDTNELPAAADPLRRRKARERAQKRKVREQKRTRLVPMTEAMIPPGSILSEQTLADIRAGHYALAFEIAPQSMSTKQRIQERRREKMRALVRSRRPRSDSAGVRPPLDG